MALRSLVFCAGSALAASPAFQAGVEIGTQIAAHSGDSAFANAVVEGLNANIPRNAAVESVVASANRGSFLSQGSPVLNLHIQETSTANSDFVSDESTAQRGALLHLMENESSLRDELAHVAARRSFLKFGPADVQREGAGAASLKAQAQYYGGIVKSSPATASAALDKLLVLAGQPNAQAAFTLQVTLLRNLRDLLRRESTPDSVREKAGSLVNFITNLPVAAQVVDSASGSYGHTMVSMPAPSRVYAPDEELMELSAGARAADSSAGDYYR